MSGCRIGRILTVLLGIVLAPTLGYGQQNLFNVPSVEATPKDRFFFQNQFNVNLNTQSNLTLCYGLGNGFEVGMNVFDVPLYNPNVRRQELTRESQQPDVLVNTLKVFDVAERWKIGVGTQFGQTSPVFDDRVRLVNFTYANSSYELPEDWGKLYGGLFYANGEYRGRRGDPVGLMFGCDIPIVKDKFHFMADLLTGRHDLSVAVVGGVIFLPRGWQLSLGAQVPTPGSRNQYGGVIELTYVPGGGSKSSGDDRGERPD